jgi:hypothetical protein
MMEDLTRQAIVTDENWPLTPKGPQLCVSKGILHQFAIPFSQKGTTGSSSIIVRLVPRDFPGRPEMVRGTPFAVAERIPVYRDGEKEVTEVLERLPGFDNFFAFARRALW